jgi:hypothetical protein
MADKKFTVLTGGSSTADPVRKLGKHGAQLWKSVMAEYRIDDIGGREMLAAACAALDRAERCKTTIDADGEVVRSKGRMREHPLLRCELSSRGFVVRTLGKLGVTLEAVKPPGRPGTPLGWIPDGD